MYPITRSDSQWPRCSVEPGEIWREKEERGRWISFRFGSTHWVQARLCKNAGPTLSLHLAWSKGVSLLTAFDFGERKGVWEVLFTLKYWSSGLQSVSFSLTLLSCIKQSSVMAPGRVSPLTLKRIDPNKLQIFFQAYKIEDLKTSSSMTYRWYLFVSSLIWKSINKSFFLILKHLNLIVFFPVWSLTPYCYSIQHNVTTPSAPSRRLATPLLPPHTVSVF